MYNQPVSQVMRQEKCLTASPQTTVTEAAGLMAAGAVSALLVMLDETLTGIFTKSDAVVRVLARKRDPQTTTLAEVMTPSPWTVAPDKAFGYALRLMHEHRVRHIPVVEDGKPVGMVSARDALDPELEQFVVEARRREGFR
jgi:CBS domain-containing protein